MRRSRKNHKIKVLQIKLLQNILRLHDDSILLFKNERYSSAYFFSAIALEEIGKLFITDEFQYQSSDKYIDQERLESFLFKGIYSHNKKQKWFAKSFWNDISNKFLMKIYKDSWEINKQKHLYVGFRKIKNKTSFDSPIDSPLRCNRKSIENQITIINDVLIQLCIGLYIATLSITRLPYQDYEKIITKDTIDRLLNSWKKRHRQSSNSYKNYLIEYKRLKQFSNEEFLTWKNNYAY